MQEFVLSALQQADSQLDSHIETYLPRSQHYAIKNLTSSIDNSQPEIYEQSRTQLYKKASDLSQQILELEEGCKQISQKIESKKKPSLRQDQQPGSLKENIEMSYTAFFNQIQGMRSTVQELELHINDVEKKLDN